MFSLTALTSLLLLNYIAKRFGDLVGKGLGWRVIAEFFMLSVPFTVAMTLPMAVLVSTLYAFSRLAAENEITALKASGVGMARVLVPVLVFAAGLAGFMLFFNDQVLPRSNHRLSTLQQDIARKKPTFALKSQVINEVSPGRLSLKADYIDQATSWLHVVTIYDMSDPVRRRTINADSGKMELVGDDLLLTLYSGTMVEVPKSDPAQLQRLFYDIDRVRVRNVVNGLTRTDSTNTYKGDREMSICEMQKEYGTHELDFVVAHYSLERALVLATRQLTTGATPGALPSTTSMPPSAGQNEGSSQAGYTVVPAGFKPQIPLTIGRVYCEALKKAESIKLPPIVKTARAAEPVFANRVDQQATNQPPAAQQPAPKDTTSRAVAGDTTRKSVAASPAAAPVPPMLNPSAMTSGFVPPRGTLESASGNIDVAGAIESARNRMLENRNSMNRYGVEIQKKFALSAACVVFVLIGAPIALRFPRGGVGLVIGVSLSVFAIYYVGLIAGEALADRAFLTPFWAMWAANVILTIVGLVLLARMGKEGATSRGGDMSELLEGLRTNLAKVARRFGVPAERRHKPA
jgi:lipopolysaccharide export system permease protein